MNTNQTSGGQPRLVWVVLALFALAAAFLGGSSRYDATQIVGLRPIAALFLIPALYYVTRENLRDFKIPLLLVLGLAGWMVLQLVPLPPGIWHSLPGREPEVELGVVLGRPDVWRPISMVPTQTLNALASLVVPIAALLLFVAWPNSRKAVLYVLVGIGAANAVLGIMQVVSGGNEALYLYPITNLGSPVGFFANNNHSAVFSAISLLVIAFTMAKSRRQRHSKWQSIMLASAFAIVLLASLVSVSRAGLAAAILALIVSGFLLLGSFRSSKPKSQSSNRGFSGFSPYWLIAVGLAGMLAAFVIFDRVPAFARVTNAGTFDDLRWTLWPVLLEMAQTYGIFGSGFGSFEEVYHIHETTELLLPSYLNQAHNDWLQYVIEGGIPAVVIAVIVLAWLIRALVRFFRQGRAADGVFWAAILAIILFASLFDYPLRAPLMQVVVIWLLALFATEYGALKQHVGTRA